MSKPQIMNTRNKVRIKHLRPQNTSALPDDKKVRIYRASPEDICFQIWRGRTLIDLSLSFPEAAEIAGMLLAEIES